MIVSVDQSTTATGYAIFHPRNEKSLVDSGTIRPKGDVMNRIEVIYKQIRQDLVRYRGSRPRVLAVEAAYLGPTWKSSTLTNAHLGELRGLLIGAARELDYWTLRVPTKEWRRSAGIRGEKPKHQAVQVVKVLYGKDVGQDEAEAILIGHHVLRTGRMEC